MCRLFGLRANRPVDLEFSLVGATKNFASLGRRNPDGFGIGRYHQKQPITYKSTDQADECSALPGISRYLSKVWIAHVRHATAGGLDVKNCHPFRQESWLFAHNGSIDGVDAVLEMLDESRRSVIEGETDSEVYFQWVLQNIDTAGDIIDGIGSALKMVRNVSHSGLNFLLTDGHSLYAYRESAGHEDYYSLYYLCRDPSKPGPTEYRSPEVGTLMRSKALNCERAVLVCSEALSDEDWQLIPRRQLLVVAPDLSCALREI